jgi:hypothetical protein
MNKAAKEAFDLLDLYVRDLEQQLAEEKHRTSLLLEQRDEDYDTLVKAITILAQDQSLHWINIFHLHWDVEPRASFNKIIESFKARNARLLQPQPPEAPHGSKATQIPQTPIESRSSDQRPGEQGS